MAGGFCDRAMLAALARLLPSRQLPSAAKPRAASELLL